MFTTIQRKETQPGHVILTSNNTRDKDTILKALAGQGGGAHRAHTKDCETDAWDLFSTTVKAVRQRNNIPLKS